MSDNSIIRQLQSEIKERDGTISMLKIAHEQMREAWKKEAATNDKEFEEICEQSERLQHAVLALAHTLAVYPGQPVKICIKNFTDVFHDTKIVGNFGLSEEDEYTLDLTIQHSPPEDTNQTPE